MSFLVALATELVEVVGAALPLSRQTAPLPERGIGSYDTKWPHDLLIAPHVYSRSRSWSNAQIVQRSMWPDIRSHRRRPGADRRLRDVHESVLARAYPPSPQPLIVPLTIKGTQSCSLRLVNLLDP